MKLGIMDFMNHIIDMIDMIIINNIKNNIEEIEIDNQ